MFYLKRGFKTMFITNKQLLFGILLVVIACQFFLNCSPPPEMLIETTKPSASISPVTVAIVPGDVIDVKFYYTPELNESQTVRPDGKISLQLIGDVQVGGKTPESLRSELITLYTPQLKNPEIVVIIRSMNERRVYVGGEVNRPGIVPMAGSLSALEAIMDAGGFNKTSAKLRQVVIIRHNGNTWKGIKVDLSKPLQGKTIAYNELQPRDIIYVPRKNIIEINQWIDQYINKIIPEAIPSIAGNYYFAQWLIGKAK